MRPADSLGRNGSPGEKPAEPCAAAPTGFRWTRLLSLIGCGAALVAAVAFLVHQPQTPRPSTSSATISPPPAGPPLFAAPSVLPPSEPPSDRRLVAQAQALADAKPEEAAPALKEIVRDTNDQAVLAVAATVADKLPADDAESLYAAIIAKGDAPSHAYRSLAEIYAKKGRLKEAGATYAEGVKKNPADFALREAYARYLAQIKRTHDAVGVCLSDIEEGKDTRENSIRRCVLAGEILFAAGEQKQARAVWEKILKIAETENEGHLYVTQIFARHNIQ